MTGIQVVYHFQKVPRQNSGLPSYSYKFTTYSGDNAFVFSI